MHRLTLLLVLGGLVLAGCQDDRSLAPGDGPLAAISDGAHSGGNPDFFFLPPMVGDPSSDPNFDPGMFNGRLRPVLAVYTNFGDDCGGDLTYGPIAVPVAPDEEMYQLDWDTDAANLTAGTTYRLCVFSSLDGGTMLGFVDLLPVTGGMKNVRTEDTFAFQDGRVVPVTFRIEQGALSYDPSDPDALGTEFTVDDEGGVAVLADETQSLAAVAVPDGAVPEGTEITIVIAQEEPLYTETGTAECLPGGLLQSDWCYQIRTEPELYQFAEPVRVEICVDVSAIAEYADDLLVHKYNETEGLVELPWAEPTLIGATCSGMGQYGATPGLLGRLGQWARRLLAPPDLLASALAEVPKGLGGMAGSFSDFGGAVPASATQAAVATWGNTMMTVEGSSAFRELVGDDVSGNTDDYILVRNILQHLTGKTSGVRILYTSDCDPRTDPSLCNFDSKEYLQPFWDMVNSIGTITYLQMSSAQLVDYDVVIADFCRMASGETDVLTSYLSNGGRAVVLADNFCFVEGGFTAQVANTILADFGVTFSDTETDQEAARQRYYIPADDQTGLLAGVTNVSVWRFAPQVISHSFLPVVTWLDNVLITIQDLTPVPAPALRASAVTTAPNSGRLMTGKPAPVALAPGETMTQAFVNGQSVLVGKH